MSMSQGQEVRLSYPYRSLEGPAASSETESGEQQRANMLLRKLIEQGLRDMAKSAQTVRDVMINAQPTEESSREQALIEYEERIAAIRALAQGVSDLQSLMDMPGHGSDIPTSDSHSLHRDGLEENHTRHEHGIEITSEFIESKEGEDTLSGLKLGGEKVKNNPEPRQSPLPAPQPNTPPATVPLHLIPLLPSRITPSNRRRTSIDPFLVATKNDEDTIDLQWRMNLSNATGKADLPSQIDPWNPPNHAAGSPGISRTLAYAMGCTQPLGSPHLPIPRDVGEEEEGTEREVDAIEMVHKPLVVMAPSGASGDQANNAAQQHTSGEAMYENGGTMEESLRRESKSLRRVTFLDVEVGKVREVGGEMKAIESDISNKQNQEGAETDQPEGQMLLIAQPHAEGKNIELMEREVEIRRAKQEVEILEEKLQAREKDLCNRLETVRQRLEALCQRKALIDRQEDSIRQKLIDASREQAVETVESRLAAAVQEIQRVGVEVEPDT